MASIQEFAGIAADAAARVPDSADDLDDLDARIEDGVAEAAIRRAGSVGRGVPPVRVCGPV